MRCLGESESRAFENILSLPDELPFFDRIFLQHNTREPILARTMIPELVHQIFLPVVVVKQRRIEPAAVEVNRIGPLAVDAWTGHEIIMEIAQRSTRRPR